MVIQRRIDTINLVRELSENKVDALEILREALSNAKDHGANRVWVRSWQEQRAEVSSLIIDDGEGMDEARLAAFWGVGATMKTISRAIGYKGHGTKLFFNCRKLSVATRTTTAEPWQLSVLDLPSEAGGLEVPVDPLPEDHLIHKELATVGLLAGKGTAILIERLRFPDANRLVRRRDIESYCDWFTVIGDVRSGLFDSRLEFHQKLAARGAIIEELRPTDGALHPIAVFLRTNGETQYAPIGQGPTQSDRQFLEPWRDDVAAFRAQPGLLAYGHRFADHHISSAGATRVRDELSALRLTGPSDWSDDQGISIIARVEGHRRQRETYKEASWEGHPGQYSFESRFGLWLCKDFIPVVQRNDLLRQALSRASRDRLQFEIERLRNWQVFINHQELVLTANRNGISNQSDKEPAIVEALVRVLDKALKLRDFQSWVQKLRKASLDRRRDQEVVYMDERRRGIEAWIQDKKKKNAVDPMSISSLPRHADSDSLLLQAPASEQELFYLYSLLSGRFRMPLHILEYDASRGVDAIARVHARQLFARPLAHARVEFKHELTANSSLDHFFDAIDAIVCWKVVNTGPIYEKSASTDTIGDLQPRPASLLDPPIDTHQITYAAADGERAIPVLQIAGLFDMPARAGGRARKPR